MKCIPKLLMFTLLTSSNAALALVSLPMNWQASKAEIKHQTQLKLDEEHEKRLTYKANLFGMPFHLEYVFDAQSQLNNVLYYHSVSPQAENCAAQYHQVKAQLMKQFGAAETKIAIYNNKANDNEAKLCQFAATGEYQLDTQWLNNSDRVNLVLNTWKGTPYIGVTINKQH